MSFLFRDVDGKPSSQASVVCIGAFDGLHLGHRALLRHTAARARALALPALALSFQPLPREYFATVAGKPPPSRLMPVRQRVRGMCRLGIDRVGLLRFDRVLSAVSAEAFVSSLLVRRLQVREIWVGPDFRFGNGRIGDLRLLQRLGAEHGFQAEAIAPVRLDDERVSSSRIRAALSEGDFAAAGRLLGAPYRIGGRVAPGRRLGRRLGFPTANLKFAGRPPLCGVYATWVHGVAEQPWPSVSSFGTRPTVAGVEPLLEAHLFDFAGDLYGRRIEVEFVAHLRDEEAFSDLDTLTRQMRRDAERARALLAEAAVPPTDLDAG